MITVHVAVGVVINAQQQVLVARRQAGKPFAGFWEFPGGNVEIGENVQQALARELQEEVNITPLQCQPLMKIEQALANKLFLLDTWLITEYSGQVQANESQELAWVALAELPNLKFPPANEAIIEKLLISHTKPIQNQ
ncbi:MAG: 8-oxo-dGTP diphosphatase MutT [Gammaproteobacteria bacterium]